MIDWSWDFLRDEQNREALRLLGAGLAALALAVWAIFREVSTARRLGLLSAEVERIKASQADILRVLERTEQRHDLLFGVIVGQRITGTEAGTGDESPDAP